MNLNNITQIIIFIAVLLAAVKPLGLYMAGVFEGSSFVTRRFMPLERFFCRVCAVDSSKEMNWKTYVFSMVVFNIFGIIAVYFIQRLQNFLPLNPMNLPAVSRDLAFNTAVSFATNTNWQSYAGEITMSYFTQMFGLTVQNFLSAATGMAVMAALIRGFVRHQAETIGNFWIDIFRCVVYILLPLSFVLAVVLVSQGVVQTFSPYQVVNLAVPFNDASGNQLTRQILPVGPVASQIAIKQLGTNGGGFFNVNSSHPFENPTPFSNFIEMLSILLIPAALCYTFGYMAKDKRQGRAIFISMLIIFIPCILICTHIEQSGNPLFASSGVDQSYGLLQSGGNMEGKETRFGIVNSAIWATVTTAASNGSVNAMHDSFMPLGGLIPLWLMQLGEVVFGGVGSGLYGMAAFVILAVFIAGLMVGRTPEYLGKKIESYEMKMAVIIILVPSLLVLLSAAVAVVYPAAKASVFNPGPHGFSEMLYAFSSAGNNNGSAFAGLNANTGFFNIVLAATMFFSRYILAAAVLAMAGSLVKKKIVPETSGTLPTHTFLFICFLTGIVLIVGALTFFPALALGPVAEHLIIFG